MKVAVMGAGSWGTAFAMVLGDAGNQVRIWARRPEVAEVITERHENPDYLPGIELGDNLTGCSDPQEALHEAELVVLAVPAQQLRENLAGWNIPTSAPVISLAKGVEHGTLFTMSQVIADVGVPAELVAVLSGPNLAREIAERQPAAAVLAAATSELAEQLAEVCRAPQLRPYLSTDVIGCEIGGACKNAIALAVGMANGLGFGANSTASVITRGLAETSRLGEALGADPHTFAGLAGMGDLVATCMSPLSRNRTFGELLGQGHDVASATAASRGVAEGVRSAPAICELAERHHIELPIITHVAEVLAGRSEPLDAIDTMMTRQTRPER